MKHKTIQQLRENLKKVRSKKQRKKLQKAYHGKRLKKWWADYANFECLTIVEVKKIEGIVSNMKGGHRHNHVRNVMERKLNKSKDSRKRVHNVINRGLYVRSSET